MSKQKLAKFDHLVVMMFENRSLDCVLGYLYEPGAVPRGQTFNGVAGEQLTNPVPAFINDGHTEVQVRRSAGGVPEMSNPNPDPGEEFQHVSMQLFNKVDPSLGEAATMSGFVHDYCNNYVTANKGKVPTFDEYRIIMDCFGPESLPVLNTLAREFAVFDAWHCAVPSQTFCNRSFFHASTSSGWVNNEPYPKWLENDAETIFNRLTDAGLSWKVYYDGSQVVSITALIHFPKLKDYWLTHFAPMEQFYTDAANGWLPAYAFIEPRLFFFHNDYHPPSPLVGNLPLGSTSDMLAGEALLNKVYSAVRNSAARKGQTH